ncbi:MAG TPA: glycosyltransferase family 2 protein [Candidatus Acidoferrales bacterium]|nr:glycosyltransferase family 2 protein [Candidatus Acidoferrales bacterium]
MHILWTGLLGLIALGWIAGAIELARGVRTIPALESVAPVQDSECPSVSILFAGRDEAEKLPGAIETMLSLDYPRYEVIAVDDRSDDATGAILAAAAKKDLRLKPARVDSLPSGWLGKPYALQQAYQRSSGEWLVFTDADVHFAPDLLRRAIALAKENDWEHLTLLGAPKMYTFGEKVALTFFGICFLMATKPWRANDPKSRGYTGVGAFQLIRRNAYEKMGTHRRLAMEVIDDIKLGKLVKEAGLRSGVATGGDAVSVHWHAGLANTIRGTTKNFFAATGFKLRLITTQIIGTLLMFVFPVAALPFARGWVLAFALIAVGLPAIIGAGVAVKLGAPVAYALTYPLGAVIICWMLTRSTIVTLWQGGVTWRGTFYSLEELKRGVV